MQELADWDSFYLIVGGAAGALIGLQFVVMTLIAERPAMHSSEASAAFSTPNIVHFGAAFFLSAFMRMPWRSEETVATIIGIAGVIGILYVSIVVRRMRAQRAYKPILEDWLFYGVLPAMAYIVLAASAFATFTYPHGALFGVGASALLMLLIGIHNAWDTTTYNVFEIPKSSSTNDEVIESKKPDTE
jgi:hypothetical protein